MEKGEFKKYLLVQKSSDYYKERFKFSESGELLVDYGKEIGLQSNPTTSAQYALSCYNDYIKTQEESHLEDFLEQVKHFKKNYRVINSNCIGYEYKFDFISYSLKSGWYSALAQGLILSIFRRAYEIVWDKEILELAVKIKNFMFIPVKEGGLLTKTPEGCLWLEEYPTEKASLVWNGFVTAVIGIYDYLQLFPEDKETGEMYLELLSSIKKCFKYYDIGFWLKYDRYKFKLCNFDYMRFQAIQLKMMYDITGDDFYLEKGKLMQKYMNNKIVTLFFTILGRKKLRILFAGIFLLIIIGIIYWKLK